MKGEIMNTPMSPCSEHDPGAIGRCEREVATVLCIREDAMHLKGPSPITSTGRGGILLVLVIAFVALAVAVGVTMVIKRVDMHASDYLRVPTQEGDAELCELRPLTRELRSDEDDLELI